MAILWWLLSVLKASSLSHLDKMTLGDYWDQLSKHDWYWDFSDDHRVWRRGSDEQGRLENIGGQSAAHKILYDGFVASMFSGEAWRTEKKPVPTRPTPEQEEALKHLLP